MSRSISSKLSAALARVAQFLGGRVLLVLVFLLFLGAAAYFLRVPVLRAVGNYLVHSEAVVPSDALYVLGGSPSERGSEAARLLLADQAPLAFCTGSNVPGTMEALGMTLNEATLTRTAAMRAGAPAHRVLELPEGTSTWEEAEVILRHAKDKGFETITVVSTEFHLRRIKRVFRKRFKGSGITVRLHAANSSQYDAQQWWTSEEGLLMVNNEYVKLFYYLLKY